MCVCVCVCHVKRFVYIIYIYICIVYIYKIYICACHAYCVLCDTKYMNCWDMLVTHVTHLELCVLCDTNYMNIRRSYTYVYATRHKIIHICICYTLHKDQNIIYMCLWYRVAKTHRMPYLYGLFYAKEPNGEVGGWGRDTKKCTGRDWGMGSSTI